MQSISRRLSILLVLSAVAAILLVTIFVNMTVSNKFNEYMIEIQNKRYERIVTYFEEAHKREGKWSSDTGVELMHEAYMGNYCLTLLDSSKQAVWGMDPEDLQTQIHIGEMPGHESGVYTTKTFEIKENGKIVGFIDIGQYSSVLLSEEDLTFKSSINKSIIASGALALIIIISLSLYFSKQFSTPIRAVAKMSVSLSQGNFDTVSNIKSNIAELEDLRKSVNILAGKLKYQDTLRKRLVSDITHEIRTPLNVLQNNLEAMIDGVIPVTNEGLHYLNEEVIRFGNLINDLNLLKEFESESIKLNYEAIFLDQLISEICKDFYRAAENNNSMIQYDIVPEDYQIIADKDKMKQVVINLISNALKFSESNGKILIKLYKEKKFIIMELIDNGIGIKQEDLPFIFERLYRGDRSRSQIKGNGIGLTIVKNILELHNAMIEVESEEGLGTTVRVYFNSTN
ncbi:HAMP domain-containing sensor histidine kinase [Neobacillus sp. YX16]|uniref:sensor histidine kinase n=1 Tax=Neobacillus sp. YX16 TaxID=3047874 RepID=UPI0024C44929|nr:HAMP domain-containing sensor histidine kinase [Neobacillus sp. YX16]WHZ01709.1 HAMP domain-containing sensor histidine kinase [Neobacillus sp. YX16]